MSALPASGPESAEPLALREPTSPSATAGDVVPVGYVQRRAPGELVPPTPGPQVTPGPGLKLPLGEVEYQVMPHINSILIRGELAEVRKAVMFLQTVDRPMPVVLVELLIVQYFHGDDFNWRFDITQGQLARGSAPDAIAPGSLIAPETGFTPTGAGVRPFGDRPWGINLQGIGLSAADGTAPLAFSAVGSLTAGFRDNLKLLVAKNEARVVTNPHVAVVSGSEGKIELDEIFNYVTSTVFPTSGATVTGEGKELTASTSLTVTPTVLSSENIHMAITTELGVFVPSVSNVPNRDQPLPDTRRNRLASSVVLGENETIIIGGLVKENATEQKNKIPGLSRLPLIGHIFTAESTSRQFTETVIYITPKVSVPQGYEDDYLEQIFEKMERLQKRGTSISDNDRLDKYRAKQNEWVAEEMDATQYHQLKLERKRIHAQMSPGILGCRLHHTHTDQCYDSWIEYDGDAVEELVPPQSNEGPALDLPSSASRSMTQPYSASISDQPSFGARPSPIRQVQHYEPVPRSQTRNPSPPQERPLLRIAAQPSAAPPAPREATETTSRFRGFDPLKMFRSRR